jgi:hypothetical protein
MVVDDGVRPEYTNVQCVPWIIFSVERYKQLKQEIYRLKRNFFQIGLFPSKFELLK